jgi:acetyltransferase-like isoleucine patch superfamily enzyme
MQDVQLTGNFQRLEKEGLLKIGADCSISSHAILEPTDIRGNSLRIVLGDGCRVGAGAVLYGGVRLEKGTVAEEYAIVGKPEYGYAVGSTYDGTGAETEIGPKVILRARCTVYGGTKIGTNSTIGHGTLLRSHVDIGENSQLGQLISVERSVKIGNYVRCSPLSHITSNSILEDRVFFGAGIMTINDKSMVWKEDGIKPDLSPPYFEYGAKIGSGSTIAAGVRIGREALVGSGSNVTHDIPAFAIAYGNPAKVMGNVTTRRAT